MGYYLSHIISRKKAGNPSLLQYFWGSSFQPQGKGTGAAIRNPPPRLLRHYRASQRQKKKAPRNDKDDVPLGFWALFDI
jgi:hypothetical protein